MLEYEAGLQQPQQPAIMGAIERDFDNFRQAWDWSVRGHQTANLHAMLNGLYLYGYLGNRHREMIGLFQEALDRAISDEGLRGKLLARRWGYLHWWYLTDYQDTTAGIEQALAIAAAQNNPFEIAFCHLMMAYTMISTERCASALPHLETSLELFEALDKPYYICWVLHRIGFIYYNLDDNEQSMAYTQRSLAIAQEMHDRGALVICLYNLGSDYILNRDYVKGKLYSEQALAIATESGHQVQLAHALSLSSLYAFSQGDFAACQDYAERARAIIEAINLLIFQPYSFCLQILLACLREDYAEGIRLNALGKRHGTSKMDLQLHAWVRAVLACGAGSRDEVRENIQTALEGLDPGVTPLISMWIIPCAAYALAETDPAKAVELLGWLRTCGESALNWVCQWPLFDRLEEQLQAAMPADDYADHWATGNEQSLKSVSAYIQRAFGQTSDASGVETVQLLTEREQEILGLIAAGLTNPQIAAQLVIGAGTVKTHTLSIYRKLDVANRTQAIRRAQDLGLLPV
jgi:ATP/maltotriose-dependent transcriptional regulator MalT